MFSLWPVIVLQFQKTDAVEHFYFITRWQHTYYCCQDLLRSVLYLISRKMLNRIHFFI